MELRASHVLSNTLSPKAGNFTSFERFIFEYVYACVCMWVCGLECRGPQRPDSLGGGVTDGCEHLMWVWGTELLTVENQQVFLMTESR